MKNRLGYLMLGYCLMFSVSILSSCVNDNLESLASKKPADSTSVAQNTTTTTTTPTTTTPTSGGTGTATTTSVSFVTDIRPILVKYQCASCHGSSYASYSGAGSLAKSGQLYGTMSWASGYRRMPPNQKASATELALLSTWIKEGSLNN